MAKKEPWSSLPYPVFPVLLESIWRPVWWIFCQSGVTTSSLRGLFWTFRHLTSGWIPPRPFDKPDVYIYPKRFVLDSTWPWLLCKNFSSSKNLCIPFLRNTQDSKQKKTTKVLQKSELCLWKERNFWMRISEGWKVCLKRHAFVCRFSLES